MKTAEEIYEEHYQSWHTKETSLKDAMIMAIQEYGSQMILANENKWQARMSNLKNTLDDMDSVAMQLEDVLHGNEGKNVTTLRHGLIEIRNIIR